MKERARRWLHADDPAFKDLSPFGRQALGERIASLAAEFEAVRAEAWQEAAAIAQFYSPGETQSDEANAAPSLRTAWTWGAVHAACKLSESFAALAAGEPRDG